MHISKVISFFLTLCVALGTPAVPYYYNTNQQAGELGHLAFNKLQIPLFLPLSMPLSNAEIGAEIQYFFDAVITEENYCIDIYDLTGLGSADENPDPARLPLSHRLGQISGSRTPQPRASANLENRDEQGLERRELIPNLYAQTGENGTLVKWRDAGWGFEYSGSSGRWSELQQFAAQWRQITPITPQGSVRIDQKSVLFMWDDADCHYCYEAYQMDLLSTLSVFDSIRKSPPVDQPKVALRKPRYSSEIKTKLEK